MPTCPTCFTEYPPETTSCAKDGAALVPDETFAHVDRDLASGTTVGEYQIESKIGEGGFGAVYRAVHPLIGKRAAVKVLSRQFSSNPQMVSRFIAEARAVNQIQSRNIIDIFSFGQLADGRQYYIMELLEGATFDAYLKEHKRLTMAEAMPILRGIARALDAAHGQGILHRDLKPENVFLVIDEDGRIEPKLLDFGLVKLLASSSSQHKTKTGTPMGTPYYMSPEQCRGLDVDARTDVYSFGALVFEVLTGGVPYEGVSAMDILFQHMTAPPPQASARCADVPPALDAALARILAKDVADRPPGVGEALEMLAAAAQVELGANSAASFRSGPKLPSTADSARAVARTEVAVPAATPPPMGQTFLASETDVAPQRGRSRARWMFAGGGALALLGVAAIVLVSRSSSRPGEATSGGSVTRAVSGVVAAPVTPSPAPVPATDEVEVRVEGAPEETIVSADGVTLGVVPGPFKLKANVHVKLSLVAKGYTTKELTITPTENVLVPVSMDRVASAPTAGATGGVGKTGAGKMGAGKTGAGKTIHSDLEGFDKK